MTTAIRRRNAAPEASAFTPLTLPRPQCAIAGRRLIRGILRRLVRAPTRGLTPKPEPRNLNHARARAGTINVMRP